MRHISPPLRGEARKLLQLHSANRALDFHRTHVVARQDKAVRFGAIVLVWLKQRRARRQIPRPAVRTQGSQQEVFLFIVGQHGTALTVRDMMWEKDTERADIADD